jgi:16S rRNA (cytosine967-C5)-methyltransferase
LKYNEPEELIESRYFYQRLFYYLNLKYIWQHITTIIANYEGGIPLSHFLKNFFKVHPKLGSRDRKILSEMVYCWYRYRKGFSASLSIEEALKYCLFFSDAEIKHLEQFIPDEWISERKKSVGEKITFLTAQGIVFDINKLAEFGQELSTGIEYSKWLHSMLSQPDLFIRVRNKEKAAKKLVEHDIEYEEIFPGCFRLNNGVAIDKFLSPKTYVVQDASSQRTGSYFNAGAGEAWWDCCSGAGGKSLLLKDLERNIRLTVSDKRKTILQNLKERFQLYGHAVPEMIVLDVSDLKQVEEHLGNREFDAIICDVPCSGSGTWSRTPEQLYFFKEDFLKEFAALQKQIAVNASKHLKEGGRLFYITCSVFKQENEEVVKHLEKNSRLKLQKDQLINGTKENADSMFIAELK